MDGKTGFLLFSTVEDVMTVTVEGANKKDATVKRIKFKITINKEIQITNLTFRS